MSVDLSQLNSPQDRQVIIVTEPLTHNESWVAMAPGKLILFMDGQPLGAHP
jgi:glutamine amidotransferase